ncbi:hypothetical protein CWI75_08205 [Kineobactrum sediminis]|uniref:Uncharacterized protein n=1 Tax=Kineobactrum sediminis TaxID=1905677 RepID=A0A2N5Y4P1_9GAMM|nr:hypothetical protein [Kineobactrum sediminis]PLW83366.1 hypothetical protein CWI75_08205 [Kineobactrum sediminis]
MSRVFLIVLMLALALAGGGLWVYLVAFESPGPFHNNLVPELIGICIEGFLLVGLLTLVQRSREAARRHELWLSLRGSFRGLLSHLDVAFLKPDADPASSSDLETNPKFIDYLLDQLARKCPDLDSLVAIKREAAETVSLSRDLVAVAAQLSASHMNWWIAIVDSIRRLAEARDRKQAEIAIHEMLVNIRELDRLKY